MVSSYAHTAVTIDCPCIPPDAAVLRARPVIHANFHCLLLQQLQCRDSGIVQSLESQPLSALVLTYFPNRRVLFLMELKDWS
jgi:hypothetical protein